MGDSSEIEMTRVQFIFMFVVMILAASCSQQVKTDEDLEGTFNTSCGCDSLWSKDATVEFVTLLEKTTASDHPVWLDYRLNDGAFVLNAGQVNDTTHCLGLWEKGTAVSFICTEDIPKMLTPLYSYYLNYNNSIAIDSQYTDLSDREAEFAAWMKANAIEAAVYMPTEFPDFPMELSAKLKTQLAIHESFHIQVMLRYWYTGEGSWPIWDKQPDRDGVLDCYTMSESTQLRIEKEQLILSLVIEALLDRQKSEVIERSNLFLETRRARYESLQDQQVKLADDVDGECKAAEAIMEIEEGIADYASWVKMYEIGVASREDLMRRYTASQKARYYLTGCMLFHASVLMNDGNESEIIAKMINANSLEEGNLLSIFEEQLTAYSRE